MFLLAKITRFSRYELWRDGRKVDQYEPIGPAAAPDPRTSEVEAKLYGLAPVDETQAGLFFALYHRSHARRRRSRTPELEKQLRALDPADELAYRYVYRETLPHWRRDPDLQARLIALQDCLLDCPARAFALAAELRWELPRKP